MPAARPVAVKLGPDILRGFASSPRPSVVPHTTWCARPSPSMSSAGKSGEALRH